MTTRKMRTVRVEIDCHGQCGCAAVIGVTLQALDDGTIRDSIAFCEDCINPVMEAIWMQAGEPDGAKHPHGESPPRGREERDE